MNQNDKIEIPNKNKIDKIDLEMLRLLYQEGCISPISSYRIKDLIDGMEVKLTYQAYFTRIKSKLIPLKYIKEGVKDSRSQTYYITEEGILALNVKDI